MERIRRHKAGFALLVLVLLLVVVPVIGTATAGTGAWDTKTPASGGKSAATALSDAAKNLVGSAEATGATGSTNTGGGTPPTVSAEDTVSSQAVLPPGIAAAFINDMNGNGTIDATDAIQTSPAMTFQLQGGALSITKSTSERGDGTVIFAPLPYGTYTVTETEPAGWTNTSGLTQTCTIDAAHPQGYLPFLNTTTPNPEPNGQDFGFIKVLKFNDLNGNGAWDGGEPGMDGVQFNLYKNGSLFDTETTGSFLGNPGYAIFWQMPLGDYVLKEAVPAGWSPTTAATRNITLSTPNQIVVEEFGNTQLSGLRAFKFLDVNGNGVQDGPELGLAGVTIIVSHNGTPIGNQVTDASGNASFVGLAPGLYTVQEVVPTGYKATTPTSVNVTVVQGQDGYAEFGNTAVASITGLKYSDLSGDGVRQTGEPGLGGVTIELWEGTLKLSQTTSSADGAFAFDDLDFTTYTLKELGAAGYIATTPTSQDVTLTDAAPHGYVEFGNTRLASIRGTKWIDENGNGMLDTGETGGSNISIQLFNANAQTQAMAVTTTGAVGTYSFGNLRPGTYIVKEIGIAGMRPVWPESVTVVLNAGDSLTVDFMNTPTASITGTKWHDLNGDGIHQANEPALPGVTIQLSGAGTGSVVTDANGRYAFVALEPGNYTVSEVVPAKMEATSPASVKVTLAGGQSATVDFLNKDSSPIGPEGNETPSSLPRTGANLKFPLILALALVLCGAVILGIGVWTRRSRHN